MAQKNDSPKNLNSIYLDTEKPIAERVQNLVSQMTLDEKVSQLGHDAPAIERLQIPKYNWWNEALVDDKGRLVAEPGEFEINIGGCQPSYDKLIKNSTEVLKKSFSLTGNKEVIRD